MTVEDYILGDDSDLMEEDNEWVEGDATQQEVIALSFIDKGELTEFPTSGFGITNKLKSRYDRQRFLRDLEIELEGDGFVNPGIDLGDDLSDFKIIV